MVMLLRDSMSSFTLFQPELKRFVGWENFARLVGDPGTRNSFVVTGLFAGGLLALVVPLALALALLLNTRLPARALIRTIVLLPTITSAVVVATMWTLILHPTSGLLNGMLAQIGIGPFDYLTSQHQALPSLILMTLWQQVGFAAMIFLAGLQRIPPDLIDAARIDGASRLQRTLLITLPLLGRTTMLVVVMMTVFSLQTFAPAYLMTSGGPQGSTNFLVHHIYVTAFSFQSPGFASAISLGLLVVAFIVSLVQSALLRTRWMY